ncbi:DNA-dependent RNA polymerase subunit epsilon [Cytobacillus sp. Hz8]|uniref:DNA-dependent RNA polymerase subunit epsilon n=1 Tax=Cytobacillus sp. Hz8 TaxID=3347168 RepID=UPI0035D5C249
MIFKVYFQETKTEIPVRENTKSLYIEAESERDVRRKLKDKPYNVEFITELKGAFLEYEKQNEEFKVLEIG